MGKVIVAEGVETEQELAMVRRIGIDRVQGFYFAEPMTNDAFIALVGDQKSKSTDGSQKELSESEHFEKE
ncbi:MAG: EAL domain-containing protein, partial [Spirochaetia bacterium]|nr:EAL domain-containing protein [Spirochaetia bacterium]